ncbi:MAG: hypothetical protein WAT81_00880 [Candidatus Moraniibacteriota bacterium]
MIKNILRFSSLGVVLISLSGCALTPPKIGGGASPAGGDAAFNAASSPGSIWRSDDGGKTFTPKTFVDEKRKLTKADVLAISFLQRGDNRQQAEELRRTPDIFVGTIDDMIFKTVDGAEVWQPVNFPPQKVYSFIASRRSVDRMYATGVVGERGKIFRTTDGGETWQDVYSEPGSGSSIPTLAEHPTDVNILYAGTSTGTVVKSKDGGDTWKNVGARVDGPIVTIAFDAKDPNLMYLLAFNAKAYVSFDAGETWGDWTKILEEERKKNPGVVPVTIAPPQSLASLVADPNISGTIYAGTKTGLYRSRDSVKTWEKINIIESAEKFPIRAFAVNPKNSDEIMFVAGRALYKSLNAGETWSVNVLGIDREVSVITYDPVYPETIYLGLRKMK